MSYESNRRGKYRKRKQLLIARNNEWDGMFGSGTPNSEKPLPDIEVLLRKEKKEELKEIKYQQWLQRVRPKVLTKEEFRAKLLTARTSFAKKQE